MHRSLFAAILGLVICGQARADAPPVSGFLFTVEPMTWTGYYLGGVGGYGSTHFEMSVPATFAPGATPDGDGWVGGVVVGYSQQIGVFVGGLEVDFMAGTIEASKSFPSLVDTNSWNITTNFGTLASLRGRVGLAMGPVLVYGTAGGAWANAQSDIAVVDTECWLPAAWPQPIILAGSPVLVLSLRCRLAGSSEANGCTMRLTARIITTPASISRRQARHHRSRVTRQ
jgi:Outer membrane protein beta-barrel domain